jgi:hypothetical protein
MSMSEPLVPHPTDHDETPAAAEPGPGAPGTPQAEEPDVLPDTADEDDTQTALLMFHLSSSCPEGNSHV